MNKKQIEQEIKANNELLVLNIEALKKELNEITNLSNRITLEISKLYSVRIGYNKAIFESFINGRKFETKSFNQFKEQIKTFFNVQ